MCRNSGAASGKILVHKRHLRLTSALKATVLEPTLKPWVQTSCGKRSKDWRIKLSEVMESMEAREAVPQHLQLVLVVQFYQKLPFLLAVPEKWDQKKTKQKNKSVFLSFAATSMEVAAFNLNTNFPSTAVRSLPWGVLQTLTYPWVALMWFQHSAEKLSSRTSCGFSVRKYKRKYTLPEALTQFPLKPMI